MASLTLAQELGEAEAAAAAAAAASIVIVVVAALPSHLAVSWKRVHGQTSSKVSSMSSESNRNLEGFSL